MCCFCPDLCELRLIIRTFELVPILLNNFIKKFNRPLKPACNELYTFPDMKYIRTRFTCRLAFQLQFFLRVAFYPPQPIQRQRQSQIIIEMWRPNGDFTVWVLVRGRKGSGSCCWRPSLTCSRLIKFPDRQIIISVKMWYFDTSLAQELMGLSKRPGHTSRSTTFAVSFFLCFKVQLPISDAI